MIIISLPDELLLFAALFAVGVGVGILLDRWLLPGLVDVWMDVVPRRHGGR